MQQWKTIKGFSNYTVSNTGKVMNIEKDFELKQGETKERQGYRFVTLRRGPKDSQTIGVHRLVAEAFCDKPEGYDVVDHIDHNRENNNASNLRWVTPAINAHYRTKLANASSKYFGVTRRKNNGRYQSQ